MLIYFVLYFEIYTQWEYLNLGWKYPSLNIHTLLKIIIFWYKYLSIDLNTSTLVEIFLAQWEYFYPWFKYLTFGRIIFVKCICQLKYFYLNKNISTQYKYIYIPVKICIPHFKYYNMSQLMMTLPSWPLVPRHIPNRSLPKIIQLILFSHIPCRCNRFKCPLIASNAITWVITVTE